MRTLEQIQAEIAEHEAALKALNAELIPALNQFWGDHHGIHLDDKVLITQTFVDLALENNSESTVYRDYELGSEATVTQIREDRADVLRRNGILSMPIEIVKEMRQAWLDAQTKEQSNA